MDTSFLKMHFSQLVNAWKISQYNTYSNYKKQKYHEQLKELYGKLREIDFDKVSDSEQNEIKISIDFFIKSLEFLNHSTINNVPYELVECLRAAMCDWIEDDSKFIIVTSYNEYSFDPTLVVLSDYYRIIEKRFHVSFKSRLVQINLPKYLERDYLCNSVLYHELGHFVDTALNLYYPIILRIFKNLSDKVLHKDIEEYFPFLRDPYLSDSDKKIILENHIREYFSDLFASQYIKQASVLYLSYIAKDANISFTHPSTQNRIKLVRNFINKQEDALVTLFQEEIKLLTKKDLQLRFVDINSDDFFNLIPCEIHDKSQLHSLFSEGWDIWLNHSSEFSQRNKIGFELKSHQIYKIINNLIEKSINNYIVETKWKKK